MGFTDARSGGVLLAHVHVSALEPIIRAGGAGRGGIVGAVGGAARVLPHTIGSIFSGLSAAALAKALTKSLVSGFFSSLLTWVASGAASLVGVLAKALSTSTEPVLTASAFGSEFDLMAALSAAIALPLVAVAAIQAIVRQEPGSLLRSVLVRLPLALLFTAVSVQIVALGLSATDQASALLIGAAGDPTRQMLAGLVSGLAQPGDFGLAAFAGFLLVLSAGVVAFLLWLELAVRSAAIAAASLFLPLALVGLAWPATAHWARRLGETLAALVLSKLVIAAVLALAAGLLASPSGLAGLVQGVALLAMASFAPFVLLKLVPAVEAGAIAHLEGLGRRPIHATESLGTRAFGSEGGGVAGLASLGGLMARNGSGGSGASNLGPWDDEREKRTGSAAAADSGIYPSASISSSPDSSSSSASSPSSVASPSSVVSPAPASSRSPASPQSQVGAPSYSGFSGSVVPDAFPVSADPAGAAPSSIIAKAPSATGAPSRVGSPRPEARQEPELARNELDRG